MHLVLDSGVARQDRETAFSGLLPDRDAARAFRAAVRGGAERLDWSRDAARVAPASASCHADRHPGVVVPSIENGYAGCAARDQLVMKTNASSAKDATTVAQGAGIGVPTLAGAIGECQPPLEVEWRRPPQIGLADHPGDSRIRRSRHQVDRLVEAFNPAKFPWFKDEFVHRRGFKAVYMGKLPTHLFGGFLDEGR